MQEPFSAEQSLLLIQSMIQKTRRNISESRFYFLLWGWLTFCTVLVQFFLKVVFRYPHHYLVHLLALPALAVTVLHVRNRRRKAQHRTYIGDSMGSLWLGIGISFFILSFLISFLPGGWLHGYPFFILFYGLGTFVSGRLLQFLPFTVGGIISWVLACCCIFVPFDYQMLLAALALLASYIIPGHLLKS